MQSSTILHEPTNYYYTVFVWLQKDLFQQVIIKICWPHVLPNSSLFVYWPVRLVDWKINWFGSKSTAPANMILIKLIEVNFSFHFFFYICLTRKRESFDPEFDKGFGNLNEFLFLVCFSLLYSCILFVLFGLFWLFMTVHEQEQNVTWNFKIPLQNIFFSYLGMSLQIFHRLYNSLLCDRFTFSFVTFIIFIPIFILNSLILFSKKSTCNTQYLPVPCHWFRRLFFGNATSDVNHKFLIVGGPLADKTYWSDANFTGLGPTDQS